MLLLRKEEYKGLEARLTGGETSHSEATSGQMLVQGNGQKPLPGLVE